MTFDVRRDAPPAPAASGLTRRGLIKAGLGLTGLAGVVAPGTAAYAAMEAANGLSITDYRLSPPGWRAGQRLTITAIADIHAGGPNMGIERVRQVVDAANALGSDLTVLLGDYFATHRFVTERVPHPAWAAELARLKAPLGVFATLGNHDWWHDGEAVRQALGKAGITVLENAAVPLPTAAGPLWLVGIGDDMTGHAQPEKAFSGIPAEARLIVMMHDPANAPALPARSLVAFAGHAHGGQVRLPVFGALLTPGRAPRQHAYGWLSDVPAPTFVTAGVGTSILPVRFNCPPETVVLRLSGKESS